MTVKVISKPLEVRAVFAKNLEPGDILVLGEGETRAKVGNVAAKASSTSSAFVEVSYTVQGLTPPRRTVRSVKPDQIYSVEV